MGDTQGVGGGEHDVEGEHALVQVALEGGTAPTPMALEGEGALGPADGPLHGGATRVALFEVLGVLRVVPVSCSFQISITGVKQRK